MGSVGRAWPLLLRYQASQLTTPVTVTCLVRRWLLLAVDQLTAPVYKELSCVQSVYLIGGQHHCKDYYLPRCYHIDLAVASLKPIILQDPPKSFIYGGKCSLPVLLLFITCAANAPRRIRTSQAVVYLQLATSVLLCL